jgi:hypothetical protein
MSFSNPKFQQAQFADGFARQSAIWISDANFCTGSLGLLDDQDEHEKGDRVPKIEPRMERCVAMPY